MQSIDHCILEACLHNIEDQKMSKDKVATSPTFYFIGQNFNKYTMMCAWWLIREAMNPS